MHLAGSRWEGGGARSPETSFALFYLSHIQTGQALLPAYSAALVPEHAQHGSKLVKKTRLLENISQEYPQHQYICNGSSLIKPIRTTCCEAFARRREPHWYLRIKYNLKHQTRRGREAPF